MWADSKADISSSVPAERGAGCLGGANLLDDAVKIFLASQFAICSCGK